MKPLARFRVCTSDRSAQVAKGEIPCILGRHVKVDPQALENYCFRLLSDEAYELALLAGVIAFADRRVLRHHSSGWARQIEVVMPVRKPDKWRSQGYQLNELLQFLTGDLWRIDFDTRQEPWLNSTQNILSLGQGRFVVVPYSNGLDSFAQSQLLKYESRYTPIRITAWNRALSQQRDWQIEDGARYRRVPIPVFFVSEKHAEPSYRTRSFLFNVFAGIAAHLSDAEAVLIPENGQGALGPSIVPFGSESPSRGSHPAVTRRIGTYIGSILGSQIQFDHPQLWRTKGEVLQILAEHDLLRGWLSTSSCPRDQRHVSLQGKKVHCGVCSGCLLRRVAASFNQLLEPEDMYLWSNLDAETLPDALHPNSRRKTTRNDIDIANHGVFGMTELAKAASCPPDDPALSQAAFEIADGHPSRTVVDQLGRLLAAHSRQWKTFREQFSRDAWINSNFSYI